MVDIARSLEAAGRQHAAGCVKTWEDLDRYGRVIDRQNPDGIVEIGTFSGKSALWFAMHTGRPVVTVDVNPQIDAPTAAEHRRWDVTVVRGDSQAGPTRDFVAAWTRSRQIRNPLVVLDGDHSADTVHAELTVYGSLVRVDGYCVVEDTLVRHMPDQMVPVGPYRGSPWDAVDRFLAERPGEWEVDVELEELHGGVGQFPGGWLRRAR